MLSSSDQIRDLVARYVRNVDLRDHEAQTELFSSDAIIRVLTRSNGPEELRLGPAIGGKAFAKASPAVRRDLPPRRIEHHCTADHLIAVESAAATLDAQFFVTRMKAREAGGSSASIVETGSYRWALRRNACGWLACKLDIVVDGPVGEPAFSARHPSETFA